MHICTHGCVCSYDEPMETNSSSYLISVIFVLIGFMQIHMYYILYGWVGKNKMRLWLFYTLFYTCLQTLNVEMLNILESIFIFQIMLPKNQNPVTTVLYSIIQ